MALSAAKERMGRTAILHKYRSLMASKFVRTEPLGSDRNGKRYWIFEGDARSVAAAVVMDGGGIWGVYSLLSCMAVVVGA